MGVTLFVSEMHSRGGVQSYMWHLLEALGNTPLPGQPALATLISYADYSGLPDDERLQPFLRNGLKVQVSCAKILKFVLNALLHTPKDDFVLVGHPGQAPVAHLLKQMGRISGYAVCLHGIEAWMSMKPSVQRALRAANKVVTTTPYTAAECSSFNQIPLGQFYTIPLSAGHGSVSPAPHFQLAGEYKLLFVARQDFADLYKRFELAFEATLTLRQQGVPACLHMVGTGNHHHNLKQFAGRLLTNYPDAVVFHGRLGDAELASAYTQCDVFVMPSLKEGFGIVFLEAMRAGKPCIGGWQGGTPYVIEDGVSGYLIPAEGHQKLVSSLAKLYHNPNLRRSMGLAALQKFESQFTFNIFTKQWIEFIQANAPCAE